MNPENQLESDSKEYLREVIQETLEDYQECHKFDHVIGEIGMNEIPESINCEVQVKKEPIEFKSEQSNYEELSDPLSPENLIRRGGKARVYVDSSSIPKNLIKGYIALRARVNDTQPKPPPVSRSQDLSTNNTKTFGKADKLVLMDHQKVHKLRISKQNIYIHSKTGYEYQIYYRGRTIDETKMEQLIKAKFTKNQSGQLICGVHERCNFIRSVAEKEYPPRFERSLRQHIEPSIVTYLCRVCFMTFGYFRSLSRHFKRHHEQSPSPKARTVMQNDSEPLMDYQNRFQLNLSDENILFTPMGHKYQVYYKGQAIRKEEQREIIQSLANENGSGWLLCSVPHKCSFRKPRKIDKDQFNGTSVVHLKKYHFTYLCRYCLGTYSSFHTLHEHSKIHPQDS